jgi:alpha-1,2-mannosyltransferase
MSRHYGERATVVGGIIIAGIFLALYIGLVSLVWDFSTLRTFNGIPLAADFANYWSASKLTLSGHPAIAYNINELQEVQQQVFGTHHYYGCGWYYPPIFFLMVFPLGLMPYLLSFFIWIAITLILYIIVLSRISPHPIILPLMVVFPGIYENFIFGQNGFLSGLFLGGGLLLLDHSPLVASILLGLLSFKPHFFVLILIALIFGRYWKVLIGTITTSIALSVISLLVFGLEVWTAYVNVMAIPMHLLEMGAASWQIMPTFFAATLSAGFGVKEAYLVQGMVMLIVLTGVAWVWMKHANPALRGSVLTLGLLLFTPYGFIYDLALLALPLCWLWEEGRLRGRLPGELILLSCGWVMPLVMPFMWAWVNFWQGKLQIGPVVLLALFFLVLVKANIGQDKPMRNIWPKTEKA